MKEFWVYTAARFAVFAVCVLLAFGVFWLIGGGDVPLLWPLLLGAILSVTVSAWLLRGLRDDFAAKVQARAERQAAVRRKVREEMAEQAGQAEQSRSAQE